MVKHYLTKEENKYGFLDNSGDIILDAVLTDTGRMRLARGDGSFNVANSH